MVIETIRTYENTLSSEFCDQVIERFNRDPRVETGKIFSGIDLNIKNSQDLQISTLTTGEDNWDIEDKVFCRNLQKYIIEYQKVCCAPNATDLFIDDIRDHGYQIQKTLPGTVGYTWHNDNLVLTNGWWRWITYIWYLNDVPVEYDGYTEFISGERIQPKQGKLLLFPSSWSVGHRGAPLLDGEKYICTGWVYCPPNQVDQQHG